MYQKLNMALTKYVFNFFPSISCAFAALWLSITMKDNGKNRLLLQALICFLFFFYFSNDLVFVAHEMSVDFRLLLSFALDLSIFGSEIPPNGRNQSLGD